MSMVSEDELPFDEDTTDDLIEGAMIAQTDDPYTTSPVIPPDHPHWIKFYVDGGIFMAGRNTRRTRGVYWSVLCEDPTSQKPTLIRRQDTKRYKTNNDAEWLAVREALQFAKSLGMGTQPIIIYSDSMLVVKQFNGEWRAKVERHNRFRTECKLLAEGMKFVVLQWVPRAVNVEKLGH